MGPFPININGNKIDIPGMDVRSAHALFRETILDGKVPVTMPIGFSIISPQTLSLTTAVGRNPSCQEATVAIAANVSGIIFVGANDNIVQSDEATGAITTGSATWKCKGTKNCTPICKDTYLFTGIRPVSIKFFVHQNAGFHPMSENADIIKKSTFFPLNTVHTLIDYVRVLPAYSNGIEVRYYNGMTPELFQRIWNEE